MAVFAGTNSVRSASAAAFKIVQARSDVMIRAIRRRYSNWDADNANTWRFEFGIGFDTGAITVIKAGARGDNDLVWLGALQTMRQS